MPRWGIWPATGFSGAGSSSHIASLRYCVKNIPFELRTQISVPMSHLQRSISLVSSTYPGFRRLRNGFAIARLDSTLGSSIPRPSARDYRAFGPLWLLAPSAQLIRLQAGSSRRERSFGDSWHCWSRRLQPHCGSLSLAGQRIGPSTEDPGQFVNCPDICFGRQLANTRCQSGDWRSHGVFQWGVPMGRSPGWFVPVALPGANDHCYSVNGNQLGDRSSALPSVRLARPVPSAFTTRIEPARDAKTIRGPPGDQSGS